VMILFTQYVVYVFVVENKAVNLSFWLPPAEFFLLTAGTLLVAAAGYIINDYYDIKIDLVNKPDRIVVGRIVSRRQALFLHSSLNFLAIFLGLLLSWHVALYFATCAFMLWFYSNWLKRTPLIGNIVISLLTAATIWIISLYFRENDRIIYIYSVFAFCISLLREVIKDMEDTKGDSAYGCKTLPIIWGLRRTKVFLIVLLAGFTILLIKYASVVSTSTQAMIYYTIMLPVFYIAYKLVWADKQKDYSQLSLFCKWVMVTGVLSLGFA